MKRQLCLYCRREMSEPVAPGRRGYRSRLMRTRDHILPREWGGTDAKNNFRMVCRDCNELRARCGHCSAALILARGVAKELHKRPAWVIEQWGLQRIAYLNPLKLIVRLAVERRRTQQQLWEAQSDAAVVQQQGFLGTRVTRDLARRSLKKSKSMNDIETAPENTRVLIYGQTEMGMGWKDLDQKWNYVPPGGLVEWPVIGWLPIPERKAC